MKYIVRTELNPNEESNGQVLCDGEREFTCVLNVMEDKWIVDKLTGSQNWIIWKFQLKHLLLAKGLWKYVDGSAVLAEGATVKQ